MFRADSFEHPVYRESIRRPTGIFVSKVPRFAVVLVLEPLSIASPSRGRKQSDVPAQE